MKMAVYLGSRTIIGAGFPPALAPIYLFADLSEIIRNNRLDATIVYNIYSGSSLCNILKNNCLQNIQN